MPLFGRNDQEDQAHSINGMIQNIIEGGWGGRFTSGGFGDTNALMDLFNRNFDTAGRSLYGSAQRDASGAGRLAGGIASSQGLNPYALSMRARNQAFGNYADKLGGLESQRALMLNQAPQISQGFRQADFDNLLRLLMARQGTTGAMDTGGGFDKILGTITGGFAGALGGGAGANLANKWF